MHEDILYHTQNWGRIVIDYFEEHPKVGLIGIAGTHFLTVFPSAWWETGINSSRLIQGYTENGSYKTMLDYKKQYMSTPTEVVAVDGVWMCMPKVILDSIRWDDKMFKGFHGYDVDMSLSVLKQGLKVNIMWDVLIEHKSLGTLNDDFYKSYDSLWKKWNGIFPPIKGVSLEDIEVDLRSRVVNLNNMVRKRDEHIKNLYKSNAYRLGNFLLKPLKVIRRIYK